MSGRSPEVHVRTWQAAYRGQVPDKFLDELSIDRRTTVWRQVIADSERPVNQIFVLEENERVVGFAHVMPSRDDDAGEGVGELTAIYVFPARWRPEAAACC
jgi:Acetyltransferase (GNAT) family